MNVPPTIGALVSSGRASLLELATVYGVEAMYDLLEINTVDAHNRRVLTAPRGR